MSYIYNPRNSGRFNTRQHYEVGDELAPGGPVGLGRFSKGPNNGMDNPCEQNQRQCEQSVEHSPEELQHPPPLMQLRQPMFLSQQQARHQEVQIPPLQKLQWANLREPSLLEEQFPPVQQLRQPIFQQHTLRQEQSRSVGQPHPSKLSSPREEHFPQVEQLRQPLLQQRQSSLPQRQSSSPQGQSSPPQWQPSPPQWQPSLSQRQSSLSQRQSSPPQWQSSPPQRQSSPPQWQPSLPQRQSSPPQWQSSPPQRQSSPPQWQPSLPQRQSSSPQEQSSPPQRQSSPPQWQSLPPKRQPSPPQRKPTPRHSDTALRESLTAQPTPAPCKEPKEKQSNTLHDLMEEMQTETLELAKIFSDNSNVDGTSGNFAGVKLKKKLSRREWRRRQNVHLRRILAPKNALIVLNEMLPGEKGVSQFKVEPAPPHPYYNAPNAHAFCAELTVDGVSYKGFGQSKLAARNDAAEQVFRDIILKHMVKLQRGSEASSGSVEGYEDKEGEENEDEDETLPMIQLASFALHKLFAEWECDGHKVPQLKALAQPPISEECEPSETIPRPAKPRRALPTNAATMHPCMLLTYMRPDLQYRELGAAGDRLHSALYTMAIDVDGTTYVGSAANKRDARREAARVACSKHFGVKFTEETNAPTSTLTPARTATTPAADV